MARLMPLLLIVSCFSKIQIDFTFLVPAHPGSPGKRAFKRVCVCCLTHYSTKSSPVFICIGALGTPQPNGAPRSKVFTGFTLQLIFAKVKAEN